MKCANCLTPREPYCPQDDDITLVVLKEVRGFPTSARRPPQGNDKGTLTAESEVGVGTTFTVRIGDYED